MSRVYLVKGKLAVSAVCVGAGRIIAGELHLKFIRRPFRVV